MTVLHWPRHRLHNSGDCGLEGCYVCNGGLALCLVCCAGEAALATDCPGSQTTTEQDDLVADGVMDYDRRLGWVARDAAAHQRLLHERRNFRCQ